jgi:uncharacterized membrane protein YqjE
MEEAPGSFNRLFGGSSRVARRLVTMAGNRLELLAVEMQEERHRMALMAALALGGAVFALLAGMTLTAAIVLALRAYSPAAVLLVLTAIHAGTAFFLCRRVQRMLQNWRSLPASVEQFRKDREALEKILP